MFFSRLLAMSAFSVFGFVAAHKGMVDTEHHRDVGVVFTGRNYTGESKFLFQVKDKPECMPLAASIMSVQICQEDVECTFYTGESCDLDKDDDKNKAIQVGCGDVSSVDTPAGNHIQHYMCGPTSKHRPSNYRLKTKPHGQDKGKGKDGGN